MKFEKVHTVNDYYDRPVEGVADYIGEPHKFKLLFDENIDEFSTDFELQKISSKEFDLIIESWSLWLKWNDKMKLTKEELDSHTVLLNDRKRYEELEFQIKELGDRSKFFRFKSKGFFNRIGSEHHDFEVKWKISSS